MDATATAQRMLEPVPANATFGLKVLKAADGEGEVALSVQPAFTNVIGSLHASGLAALVDAAGLAAIIGASDEEGDVSAIVPLGAVAELRFLRPARGELVATCACAFSDVEALRALFRGDTDRLRLSTDATVTDAAGETVATGRFDWRVRRR
jgi:acyl-coenzyme A thioesterase PaaI-like protein